MRLPQPLLESQFFQFSTLAELVTAAGDYLPDEESRELTRLSEAGLPVISSDRVVATLFGINLGLLWSFINRPHRYYRSFRIPKGNSFRQINAPRVGLKIIQKWISVQLEKAFSAPQHVFGFVRGRSHVDAAAVHLGAQWVFSVDIENFFPTTPISLVRESLEEMGFASSGASMIAGLSCLNGGLAQGSPCSPVLSNICFRDKDRLLLEIGNRYEANLSRYADDIVFSGQGVFPEHLRAEVLNQFVEGPWILSERKTDLSALPDRLKVHGLLVHGDKIRLTKGYRKKLRLYKHLLASGARTEKQTRKLKGHISYAEHVEAHILPQRAIDPV